MFGFLPISSKTTLTPDLVDAVIVAATDSGDGVSWTSAIFLSPFENFLFSFSLQIPKDLYGFCAFFWVVSGEGMGLLAIIVTFPQDRTDLENFPHLLQLPLRTATGDSRTRQIPR